MENWYYADAERQRQGPLTAEELTQRFHQGLLRLDTLVWREGLAEWQPLRDFTNELALHQAPAETFYTPVEPVTSTGFGAGSPPSGTGDGTDSPYAPPSAALTSSDQVHAGGEVVYSGLWKRFAASILDSFVTGILSYVVLIPMMLVMGLSASGMASSGADPFGGMSMAMALLTYPVSIGIPAIYFGWMHASSTQASLGKMAVGAKVVRSDGQRIGFWRGFLRYVVYILFTLVTCGLGVLISGLMVAFTERKQALHDMICDTLVVDKWAFTAHPEWQKRELGTVTVVILAIFGVLLLLFGLVMAFALAGIASSVR